MEIGKLISIPLLAGVLRSRFAMSSALAGAGGPGGSTRSRHGTGAKGLQTFR
jgi:hypothetical protein